MNGVPVADQGDESALWIDGKPYVSDDLTFREQRQLRDYIRQLAPGGDQDEAGDADIIPALVTVIRQRDDQSFTLEQALDMRPSDVERPPTKRAAAKK